MDSPSLNQIKDFYFKRRRLPTYREMQKIFGFASKNAVAYAVYKWIKEGILKMDENKLVPTSQFFGLPLLGSIKAGSPTTEDQYLTETVSLDEYLVGNPGFAYLLRVSGDSMDGEGIRSGDLVILDKKREPKNGDIVAAYIDNEWTLKYFKKNGGQIHLEAANPKYRPLIPKESLSLGGVVVSVIRKYY
ncbi:repressor LexA [Candidatus Roizmanbacteria bacterium]|nr:repressor LexA [Candidatus Roizmanbacteria bacterium]